MKLFNKVAIIGVGLIGGSMALGIKKKRLAGEIVGVVRHKKSLLSARKIGAIDEGSLSLDIIKGSDLVIMASPINAILEATPKILEFVSPETIVSDVGSTKELIVSRLEKIFPNFVGAHPLAGSEKRGVVNASPDIFKGSLCILTSTKLTPPEALHKIKAMWQGLGAETALLTPENHDRILSFTSHLPHVAAFSLASSVPAQFLKFTSTGFKDTTRIAASESEIWSEIFLSNRKNLLKTITVFEDNLREIKRVLQKNDKKQLSFILNKAKSRLSKAN